MSIPLHQYASVPVAATATAVHDRLTAAPHELVTAATADALRCLAPAVRAWGLSTRALPTVATGPGGDEDATGWPALTAWLVATPDVEGRSRLALVSHRSPGAELATVRLDRLHRQRLTRTAVQTFLRALADRLQERVPPRPTPGPGTRHPDRTPTFLHDTVTVPAPAEDVVRRLLDDPYGRAVRATDTALDQVAPILAAGRFRDPARPTVAVRPATDDELGAVIVQWDDVEQPRPHLRREDATGWPTMTLTLVATPVDAGTRLAVLSPREPGYDLSVNRVDKHVRDQLARAAVHAFLAATAAELQPATTRSTATDTSAETRVPVVAG